MRHTSGGGTSRCWGNQRSRCCLCPTTERELADGIGPTAGLRDAGVELCVGSDSHAVIDPFEETRAVELNERLAALAPRQPPAGRPADGGDGVRLRQPRMGRRRRAGRRRPRRLRDRRLRQPPPRRRRPMATRSPPSCSPPRRRTFVTWSSVATSSCATEPISDVDVTAELDRSISAAWAAVR